jgi:hypothetical protein
VRGFNVIASTSLKSSLTLPLSLAKGEATPDGATHSRATLQRQHTHGWRRNILNSIVSEAR